MKKHYISAVNTAFAVFIIIAIAILIADPNALAIQVATIVIACANLFMHIGWTVRFWLKERNADQEAIPA